MNFSLGYNIFRFHYCKLCQIKLVILDQFYVWLRIPFYHKDRGDELFFNIVDKNTTEQEMKELSINGNAYSEVAKRTIIKILSDKQHSSENVKEKKID